ncbi:MAG: carboxypeptidase regulatory-like domain-containing protein [Terriglobia bacterium]
MKKRTNTLLAVAMALLMPWAASLWGQVGASAEISGLVSDSSGAVVPNAKVTATHIDTGLVRTAVSDPDGIYALPNLPVGSYRLEVEARGFQTYVQTGILLQVSNTVTINVTLQVGQVKQQVQVSANASMVQTQTTSIASVMDNARVLDLPLNGRQATDLIMLMGAATNTTDSNLTDIATSKNYATSDSISVAGGQSTATSYRLDGGTHMDNFSNINLPFPFPDAIQEFSVETGSITAQAGLHPGAQVEVVTKSGTNQFHGDAFEFVRNGDFNARDFFAPTQDTLKRNQFGGTIGGPIKKDKVFGFFGYQGTRVRTAPPSSITFVPTAAVLSGDWSQIESAACQSNGIARTIMNPATGQPFANDFVSPSLYNQQALNLLKYVPSTSNPCGEITYAIPEPQREDQYIGRVDWNQSARNNLFGRYFFADYKSPAAFDNNFLLTTQRGVLDRSQAATIGDNYSITPDTLNTLHLTWTRLAITRGPAADMKNLDNFGVNIFQAVPNAIDLGITGYFGIGCGTCAPALFKNNVAEVSDDLDLVRGKHHMSLGVDWIHYEYPYANNAYANGGYTFSGASTNDGLLDFLLGIPSFFDQGNPTQFNGRQNYVGVYFNDNLQTSRRFNINLGLRWEPNLSVTEVNNAVDHFSEAAFIAGTKSSQFVNAPPGLFYPGDPGIPRNYTYSKLAAFDPRVGIVWDPTGSGRQVIRAGFGVFFDTIPTAYFEDQTQGAPWGSVVDLNTPAGGLTNPWLGQPGGNPFPLPYPPSKNAVFPSGSSYYDYPLNSPPMYVDQWDLSYQLQLANNWMLAANYVGNKSTHIWTGEDINPAIFIPGMCNGTPCSTSSNESQHRLLYLINPVTGSAFSDIYHLDAGSNGEYEALLLKLQHRFSSHYTILGNYTYSHCISEGDFQGDMGGPYTQNPFSRNAERGNCSFDIRHIFNLTFIAQSPHFANPWTNRLLGNWQLSPIIAIHSGTWFYALDGFDNSLSGVGLDRPNVAGNPYTRSTTGSLQWLNPSAFSISAPGTFGNLGRSSLLAPGYFDIDAAVSRYFNITERHRIELRFEFFNLTNEVNFSAPDATVTDATFGQIQSDVSPRILQFALKYTF